jgi:hypothetical protein
MADFYQRRIAPQFANAADDVPAKLLKELAADLERLKVNREKDEDALRITQFQNTAQRAAMDALAANPADEIGYQRQFRDTMRKIPTPIAQQGRYGAIAESVETRYLWTIAANRERERREALKFNVGTAAADFEKNGIGCIGGTLEQPSPTAAADFLTASAAELHRRGADGTPLFSEGEIASRMDEMGLAALTGRLGVDISGETPIGEIFQILDPTFDYAVSLPTGGETPLEIRLSDLSDDSHNQFQSAAAARIAEVIGSEKNAQKLAYGQQLWTGAEQFLPGNSTDLGAIEAFAAAQVAREPITSENFQRHINNCGNYLQRFALLPEPYSRAIQPLTNADDPESAAMGAQIIVSLMEISPDAAAAVTKAIDGTTLLRANMLYGLIRGGTPLTNAFATVKTAMATDAGILKQRLKDYTGGAESREKFYGTSVTVGSYGSDGVAEYRRMVDTFFLTNGGDRRSAVAVAKARMDAEYAETRIGADRDWRIPIFGRKRRKYRDAPEAVYGANSSEIINEILREMAPEISRKTGIHCDLDHLILVPTPATHRAVEAKENPTWAIFRRNDNGSTSLCIDQETGIPIPFSLDEGGRQKVYEMDLEDAAENFWTDFNDHFAVKAHKWAFEQLWGFPRNNFITVQSMKALNEAVYLLKDPVRSAAISVAKLVRIPFDANREAKRQLLLKRKDLKTKTPPKAIRERAAKP